MERDPRPQHRPYLFKATDSSGKSVVTEVVTDSTTNALRYAHEHGFTNVQILTDEISSLLPTADLPNAPRLKPADLERIQTTRGLWAWRLFTLRLVYRPYGLLPLAGLLGILACILWSASLPVYVICAVPIAFPLAVVASKGPSAASRFRKLQNLYISGRFEEVLRFIPILEQSMKGFTPDANVAFVATQWRSKAMTRLGRLDEALADIDQLGARPDIAPSQVETLRLFAFGCARQYEQVAESARRLQELEPNNPTGYLAHAETLAVWMNRPSEARVSLEKARSLAVSDGLKDLLLAAEGEVLLAEGHFREARIALESAVRVLRTKAVATPFARPALALIETQLAVAFAHLGDQDAARRHWRSAEPLMRLHDMEPWVTKAERAVGTTRSNVASATN